MTVKSIEKDTGRLTLNLVAEFDAPVEKVWRLWQDPRQLERWWGPPGYPATFVDHDFRAGGTVTYYMTSPEGEKYHGWWRIGELDPPARLEFEDGFGDSGGEPDLDMPVTATTVSLEEIDPSVPRTRMTMESRFASIEAMEQLVEMGMEEGLTQSVGQMDGLLEESARG